MIRKEWKNIFHNWWIVIVLIAIILIPSIYSVVFLGSMWDPYGHTGQIPVAIVNEDQEVVYNDQRLAIGEELVKNLKDSDAMEFHFTDATHANEGLENGDYYMIVTIPSDFSKNATTLLDEHPQKMTLGYTTHPGTNYIASKMDDSAITAIKDEVSATVTKTYAQTIFDQVDVLSSGLDDAVDGTQQLSQGVHQLIDGNQVISDNLKVLANSTLTFEDGAQTLSQGLKDYTDGVLTVHNGVYSLKNGVSQLSQASPMLSQGMNELNQGSQTLNQGIQDYTQGVLAAYAGTSELVKNNESLNQGVKSLSDGVNQLSKGNQTIVNGVNQLSDQVKNGSLSLDQYLMTYHQLKQLNVDLANIIKDQGLNQQILDELKKVGKIDEKTYQIILSKLPKEGLPSFEQLLISLNAQLKDVNTALNGGTLSSGEVTPGLVLGTQSVQKGINELQSSVDTTLKSGIQQYTLGVSKVNDGLNELTHYNDQLTSGSQALSQGTQALVDQTPALTTGIQAIDQGVQQLYDGTSQLVTNNQKLVSGSQALNQGAVQISDGSQQLADGSKTLGNGLQDMDQGVSTLNTGLAEGAKESKINSSDDTYDMVSAPVSLSHKEISTVENNGHAMAPYMMSVALYVAGMAFVLMYPLRKNIKEAKNGLKYWLSKASVMYTISTVAAIVLITSLRMINGFHPQNLMMTYIFAIIVSAAFMSIIVLLNLTTGFIGDFILLVFMIINLGGSAGTYPLETSSAFYKAIHPFVPYTYSVDGFRKVISMPNASLNTEFIVFISIIVVCSLLTILYFHFKNKEDKHIIPQAFETHEG